MCEDVMCEGVMCEEVMQGMKICCFFDNLDVL